MPDVLVGREMPEGAVRPALIVVDTPRFDKVFQLETHGLPHTRSAPYHPMTQGKIERYHRSLKNVVKLEHYYTSWEVERAVAHFVEDYNHRRYQEALQNVTPAEMFYGRQATILARRARINQRTVQQRKREHLHVPPHAAIGSEVSL